VEQDGTLLCERADIDRTDDELRSMYSWMLLARRLDEACIELQARGGLTVYPPLAGQEAAQVGSAFALGPDDFVFPSFRELGVALVRGVDPAEYLQYHRGTWHGGPYDPLATRFAPICVPLATQIVHAVGYAMGLKLDGRDACSIAYFGDGSASEGDFHEACNFAAVFGAPMVLFCQNNGWAISVPFEKQAAAPIHLRAAGYGIASAWVDGNDVLAVWQATRDATERARSGGGPTLIEAMTWRMGPHTTSDDPSRYRDPSENERRRMFDPLERYAKFLVSQALVDLPWFADREQETREVVDNITGRASEMPEPAADEITRWVFAEPPPGWIGGGGGPR
jgi:pyruvate dehydrogenase E1 component alpha subunit